MLSLYYVLGAVAKVNASLWRHRINFVPTNVLAIGIMVGVGIGTVIDAIEGLDNAHTPLSVSVAQIHDAVLVQNYVSVTGVHVPAALFEYGTKTPSGDSARVSKSWTPLLDRANHRILLVQREGKVAGGDPHESSVTGMLRELDATVRASLASQNDTVQGIPVETRYMLVANEHPASSMTSALISLALFGVVTLFVFAAANRNTIFQRADLGFPVAKVKSVESLTVHGTGTFALKSWEGIETRFIEIPSVLARLENGNAALVSNIDASRRFMGITTSERSGIWSMAIVPGSVHETQAGFIYWGAGRRPAVRFKYVSPGGDKRRAIITADTVQVLGFAVALITMMPASHHAPAMIDG